MRSNKKALLEILFVSIRLGFTSFGGPVAHLGYFHEEYIRRRKWLDEKSYADLVALCQFLPGPTSSQVGIGIGVSRSGVLGGLFAFIGFTLPSVVALIFFAYLMQTTTFEQLSWIHGLKIVAVAVVAHAILGMAQTLTPDTKRRTIALFALVSTLLWQTSFTQIIIIILSALIGFFMFTQSVSNERANIIYPLTRRFGIVCLLLFTSLLILLPIVSEVTSNPWIAMFDSFFRSGSLVFGGGHVVLPLLEREFVPNGLISEETFLAGYGVTQAVPGPLFTFAAYLGAIMDGWRGGLLATIAIFLPAFLLVLGTLPFWNVLSQHVKIKGALLGVNAAVVGILIAALYQPIWTSTIESTVDFCFVAILFSMLAFWKFPPWIVVLTGAIVGAALPLL